MEKAEFVRSLQTEDAPLSPFEISQRVRKSIGCVSLYHGDPGLLTEDYRAYMIKWADVSNRSPDNPELYFCVTSLNQSKAWQDISWIKEILQILDKAEHRTNDKDKLLDMLMSRVAIQPHDAQTPGNVLADMNGLVLALGSAIPLGYRKILREQNVLEKHSLEVLEEMINVPADLIDKILSPEFEEKFEAAIESCS